MNNYPGGFNDRELDAKFLEDESEEDEEEDLVKVKPVEWKTSFNN